MAADFEYTRFVAETMMPMFGARLSLDDAIGRVDAILRRYPAYYPAMLHLGLLQAGAGRTEEARHLLLQGADRLAERASSLAEQRDGILRLIEGLEDGLRYDLAGELLQHLVRHYPAEAFLHDALGAVLVVLGKYVEAIQRFDAAVAREPRIAHYHCNLGWGCLSAGRLDDAKAHLKRSLALDARNETTRGNIEVLRFLERNGGTYEDYLLRPLDRRKLGRLETRAEEDGAYHELDRVAAEWNHARLEAWKLMLCRRRHPPEYPEVYKSLRAFFRFVEELSQDSYTLVEDLNAMARRYKPVTHKFIFKMADADAAILEEICAGLLSFYGYLTERGLAGTREFAAFRSEVVGLKQGLIEKAERYAHIRHDDSIPEREKDRIRDELFEGDHLWPWI